MLSLKEQEITDAFTGVQLAIGRHPLPPGVDPDDPKSNETTQWLRITANGKVSTVFFYPDGGVKNIQNHPKLPGVDTPQPNDAPAQTGIGNATPLGSDWHDAQAAQHPDPAAARAELDANRAIGVASGETMKQHREREEAAVTAKQEALDEQRQVLKRHDEQAAKRDVEDSQVQSDVAQPWAPVGSDRDPPVPAMVDDETLPPQKTVAKPIDPAQAAASGS